MLLDDDHEMNDGPVADDGKECFKRVLEERHSAATDGDSGDEADCDEGYARHAKGPGTKVLSVEGKGVVVWNVVLTMFSL